MRLSVLVLLIASGCSPAAAQPTDSAPSIPHTRFVLDNGMQVVFHVDATVPLVAVNLNYNVGSSDEVPGRTGFAHLFEHLMFMGTDRVPQGKFDTWMETAGGWNNAWTSEDRTDYYDVGPKELLETLLWMEADRMEALGGAIDEEKLDLQRDVVRNERRQTSENQPYGVVELTLPGLVYPEGHPYSHPVIGSHEDLQAASVDDVRAFFASWYSPWNASLVVAGDFDPEVAEGWVRAYFGALAGSGPKPERRASTFERATPRRMRLEDRVNRPRVLFVARTQPHLTDRDAELDVLATVLSKGKASRLHRVLVHERRLALDVYAGQWSGRLESQFVIWATAREGVAIETLEDALSRELEILRAEGPVDDELVRAKAGIAHAFARKLDGVAGRASMMNTYMAVKGTPDWLAEDLARYARTTPESVRIAAFEALDPAHRVILVVVPKAEEGTQ
jgi:predicted Zn-dependent peptidase